MTMCPIHSHNSYRTLCQTEACACTGEWGLKRKSNRSNQAGKSGRLRNSLVAKSRWSHLWTFLGRASIPAWNSPHPEALPRNRRPYSKATLTRL